MRISPTHYQPTDKQKAAIAATAAAHRAANAQRRINRAAADKVFALWPESRKPMDNPFVSNFSDL